MARPKAKPSTADMVRGMAQSSLLAYALLMRPEFQTPPHIRIMAKKLEDALARVEQGEKVFMQIFMPPQNGKSTMGAEIFIPWVLGKHPDWGVAYGAYAGDFAEKRGGTIRDILQHPLHREVFPSCELSKDSTAKAEFYTTKKGGLKSVGRGGGLTGYPVKVMVIDDPFKDQQEADSGTIREACKNWYNTVVKTRQPRLIIIINTRWHVDDLSGYTLREHAHDNWEVISFPAINEDGESLWPEKYPVEDFLSIKAGMPARQWASLYQQQPYVADGNLINPLWFGLYTSLPTGERCQNIVQSWDVGNKTNQINDPSACTTWAIYPSGAYLLDVVTKRLELPALYKFAKTHADRFKADLVLIEDKQNGTGLAQHFKEGTRLPVKAINPGKLDKTVRAQAVSPVIEGGRVFIPSDESSALKDFIAEVAAFPGGKHDDQVDSMVMFLDWYQQRIKKANFQFNVLGSQRRVRELTSGW